MSYRHKLWSPTGRDEDLDWCVRNRHAIWRRQHPAAKKDPPNRPLLVWRDGRVRVEFVGTYDSAAECREQWERWISQEGGEA